MPVSTDDPRSRSEILKRADELINGDRQKDYGEALENFTRIGQLWYPILKEWNQEDPVPPSMVALMLTQLKVARLIKSPQHIDSVVDGAAYLALGGELAWRE